MEAAVPIALAIAGSAAGASSASAKNRSIRSAQQSANRAASAEAGQANYAAAVDYRKQQNRAEIIAGRLRVAAAESGVGFGGSFAALDRQVAIDDALNRSVILNSRDLQLESIRGGLNAQLVGLRAQYTDPIFAAFTGGLQGGATGLSIMSGVNGLSGAGAGATPGVTVGETSISDIGGAGALAVPSYGASAFV